MIKTLIYNLPPLDLLRPPLSGAILASVCKNQGHECLVIDLQQELNQFLTANGVATDTFDDVFFEQTPSFNQIQIDILKKFVEHELRIRQTHTYDYILISFFSYLAQVFGGVFLDPLRRACQSKIIIGGAGIASSKIYGKRFHYAQSAKQQGLIDEYITGEAEQALVTYFQLGHGPGIGNEDFVQVENLDEQVWPDYSFFDISKYAQSPSELTIVGSRGCVRQCTFCDVAQTSPKFRYRSGSNIAREIINHYETHGVTRFYFADSLVNGSLKAFDDMCEHLAGYKFQNQIRWSGQYIIRPQRSTPRHHFDNLAASGCETLFLGLESGSDRVRVELGKKFTNDDVEFYLENFAKHDIGVLFLMFSGYVSETEQDHQETLSMFPRWQRFVATGTIRGLETLNILTILPGTALEKQAQEHGFVFLSDDHGEVMRRTWLDQTRPDFDFPQRVRRHIEMIEHAMDYRWPLWNGLTSVTLYEQALLKFQQMPKKYMPLIKIHETS